MKKIILILLFTICAIALKAQTQARDSVINSKNDERWIKVDKVPEFPGGFVKCIQYIEKNLKYPKEARKNGIKGKVFVGFVVEKDGSLTNVRVLKSLSPATDAEAIRLINASPKWEPGSASGVVCRVDYSIPIEFGNP